MINGYAFKKNTGLVLICAIGLLYLASLMLLSSRILPMLLAQIQLIIDLIRTNCSPTTIFSSVFYFDLVVGILAILLWGKVLLAIVSSYLQLKRTSKFINNLNYTEYSQQIRQIQSRESHIFTAGLLNPKIYISKFLLNEFSASELKSVIAHETYHLKSYDPLKKIIVDFIQKLLPPLPTKQSLFSSYEVLSELAADEYTQFSLGNKKGIISALDKVLSLNEANLNLSLFGLHNDRISILLGVDSFGTKQFFGLACLSLLFLIIGLVSINEASIFSICHGILNNVTQESTSQNFSTSPLDVMCKRYSSQ
jgi:Zn-dependent protease with chaperone function